jgi:hypothetical protein
MTYATLNRTDLTTYEAAQLHATQLKIAEHSIAVGAFVARCGRQEVRLEAAELFLQLLETLVNDENIRTGALAYERDMSEFSAAETRTSQATQLRERFAFDLYRAAVAERETVKVAANA